LEDYPIEFIKSYLWGKYIRKREKTYNPGHILNEFPYRLFICDGCGKERIFYATHPIPGTRWHGLYCWSCWKKRTRAKKKVDVGFNFYIFDNEDFIEYLDISHALEKIEFTARQKHVLHFYMMEHSERMIAEKLELHKTTVHRTLKAIFQEIYSFLNGNVTKTPSKCTHISEGVLTNAKIKL
jgi:hypothetical protein